MTSIIVAGRTTNLYKVVNSHEIMLMINLCLIKLENDIIRDFEDARIHCAINCASYSCPPLPRYFYDANNLNDQFDTQSKRFLSNKDNVQYTSKT